MSLIPDLLAELDDKLPAQSPQNSISGGDNDPLELQDKVANLVNLLMGQTPDLSDESSPPTKRATPKKASTPRKSLSSKSTTNEYQFVRPLKDHSGAQIALQKLHFSNNFKELRLVHKFLFGEEKICADADLIHEISDFDCLEFESKQEQEIYARKLEDHTKIEIMQVMDNLDIMKPPTKRMISQTEFIKLDDGTQKVIETKRPKKSIKGDYIEVLLRWLENPYVNNGIKPVFGERTKRKNETEKRKIDSTQEEPTKKAKLEVFQPDFDYLRDTFIPSFESSHAALFTSPTVIETISSPTQSDTKIAIKPSTKIVINLNKDHCLSSTPSPYSASFQTADPLLLFNFYTYFVSSNVLNKSEPLLSSIFDEYSTLFNKIHEKMK